MSEIAQYTWYKIYTLLDRIITNTSFFFYKMLNFRKIHNNCKKCKYKNELSRHSQQDHITIHFYSAQLGWALS